MSTNNIYDKLTVVMNGRLQEAGNWYAPATVANALEILSQDEITVAATTVTTILSATSAAKVIRLEPSVATSFVWSSSTDADNSAVVVPAGCPFYLYTSTLPYQNTTADRADETAANITTIKAYASALCKVKTLVAG